MTDDDKKLVKRLRVFERWLYAMDLAGLSEEQPNLNATADRIEALQAEVERLREWSFVALADMSKARGRLETIATCNEDRRLANALGRTCDCLRAALENHNGK